MNSTKNEPGGLRGLAQRYAPGLEMLSRYEAGWLRHDIPAGLSVAAIALPVGIAYSQLVGVPAVVGMYSAIFPLIVYALFGSSRQLMIGPDGATCILAAAILAPIATGDPANYLVLVVALTLITGLIYIAAGLLRLGFVANFLSQPILVGYLNGVALIIMVGQIPKVLGISVEAGEFFPKIAEIVQKLGQTHGPTFVLALVTVITMVAIKRFVPRVPGALVVVVGGIIAVAAFGLERLGIAILGEVPAGLPEFRAPFVELSQLEDLIIGAAGLVLVSFTSGVLTAKSFARRAGEDVDANKELIAFGAGNLLSGIMQGYPVTGADSRTAVNFNMGGKTQLVGLVAAATMLLILFFLTDPLGLVPSAALAAVVLIAGFGLLDIHALRDLFSASYREFMLSLLTTAGVLVLGVLTGVLVAVGLTFLWMLSVGSRPHVSVLGRVPDMKGFHPVGEYPDANTVPGLILFRFDSDLVFFNIDNFRDEVRRTIAEAKDPVRWFIVDVSPVNIVDATAVQKFQELGVELAGQGILLGIARPKGNIRRFFRAEWADKLAAQYQNAVFPTLRSAMRAYEERQGTAAASGAPAGEPATEQKEAGAG